MSGLALVFFVPGVPIAQGSKVRTPYGMRESNDAKLKPWRASIVEKAPLLDSPLRGALSVEVVFYFPRPRHHYRTGRHAHELREGAPLWHIVKPDCDKLIRALGDALSGVVLGDDSQIAHWKVSKQYDDRPGAHIVIRSLATL